MTSYQYAGNNPIMNNDPLGDLAKVPDTAIPSPAPNALDWGGTGPGVNSGGGGGGNFTNGFGGVSYNQFWSSILFNSGLNFNYNYQPGTEVNPPSGARMQPSLSDGVLVTYLSPVFTPS